MLLLSGQMASKARRASVGGGQSSSASLQSNTGLSEGAEPTSDQVFSVQPGVKRQLFRSAARSLHHNCGGASLVCIHEHSRSLGWPRDLWRRRIEPLAQRSAGRPISSAGKRNH